MTMQIYLIDIGGDKQCWKAETPQEAMDLSLAEYVSASDERDLSDPNDPPKEIWGRLFRSCERVGTLANP
jgi:hypothetical protein